MTSVQKPVRPLSSPPSSAAPTKPTASRSQDLLQRRAAVLPNGVGQVVGATASEGHGAILTDLDGRELIDFAGGIGVMNAGHGQKAVLRAIQEQSEKLVHTCIHVATYEPYIALCEKLVSLFPHGGPTKAMLTNTGAEAVENAIKIARQATGRSAVLCFTEAFHGRTLLCMSLTSKVGYKIGCGPFAPEIFRLPYPNYFKYGDGLSESEFVTRELVRLRQALVNMVPPEHLAAIILEPVQGEGGFVPAPVEYLRGLRSLCDEFGIKLILDEVQTGFCRTGKWAAYEHSGVIPDLSTWAKSMGGGLPIGAVLGKAEVMDAARPGTLGGTYGGNPVACAAALATIQVMEEQNLNHRANVIGERLRSSFELLRAQCSLVGDVRGLGAMMAVEFVHDKNPHKPASALVKSLLPACLSRGLLVLSAGAEGNILRVLCPLVITDEELDRGLRILSEEVLRLSASAA